MRKQNVVVLFLLLTVCLFGEEKKEEKVVATIGSEKITLKEVEEELNQFRWPGSPSGAEAKKQALEQMVRERVLLKAAREANVKLTEQEEKRIEKMRQLFVIRKYVEEELKKKPITDEEVKVYYENNTGQFSTKEKRKISQILLKDQKQAEEILKKLKEGADFATLAKENSIDGSKEKGGDLGWVTREGLPKEVGDSAFSLAKGELSGIIKSSAGYHLVKVEDIKPAQTRPLETVSQEIRRRLEQERIRQLEANLREKYKVNIDYTVFETEVKK